MSGGPGADKLTNTGTLNFTQTGAGTGSRVFTGDLDNNGAVAISTDAHFNKNGATYNNTGQFTIPSGKTLTIQQLKHAEPEHGRHVHARWRIGKWQQYIQHERRHDELGARCSRRQRQLQLPGRQHRRATSSSATRSSRSASAPLPEVFQLDYSNTLASDVRAGSHDQRPIQHQLDNAAVDIELRESGRSTSQGPTSRRPS